MRSMICYVGLDVHKETITIVVARGEGEPAVVGTVANSWMVLERQLKRLGPPELLRCCYEAGLCGYEIYRRCRAPGSRVWSWLPGWCRRRQGAGWSAIHAWRNFAPASKTAWKGWTSSSVRWLSCARRCPDTGERREQHALTFHAIS